MSRNLPGKPGGREPHQVKEVWDDGLPSQVRAHLFRARGSYEMFGNASRWSYEGSESNAVVVDCRVDAAEPCEVGVVAAFIVVCQIENEKLQHIQVGFFRNVQLNHLERKECVGNCA